MKNNQFKKLIRTKIEESCSSRNFQCVYVDQTNNERMFYIYDSDFKLKGQISLYLSNDKIRMRSSYSKKPLTLANYDKEVYTSYAEFEKALVFMAEFFFFKKLKSGYEWHNSQRWKDFYSRIACRN